MSDESDINYLIGGLVFGGLLSLPVAIGVPYVEFEVRLGIGAAGCVLGVGLGFLRAWTVKRAKRRRIARAMKKHNETTPLEMPTQIAGKTCLGCESHIVFAAEGSFCKICFQPFCVACKKLPAVCAACVEKQPA